ncbi:MAG: MBL fold metallo-hydrolase [Oscillospiraceae bacterium]|nr:MBL fold metallo-hydrolase [Oscillospiraceae bacterium]
MSFTITVLMENTAPEGALAGEHGLSLLVEGQGVRVLYDTGPSPRFLFNARALGAELEGLDALVLSHGHYDHTGGAAALLTGPKPPKSIYLGRDFFTRRFKRGGEEIGSLLDERTALQSAEVHVVGDEPARIAEGVFAVSVFTLNNSVELTDAYIQRETSDWLDTDTFCDETALVLETPTELTLISGCSHVGCANMCTRVEELFGRKVDTFIGGTHLMNADDERIEQTARLLRQHGVRRLGACHCTGCRANEYFASAYPGWFASNVGSRVTVG